MVRWRLQNLDWGINWSTNKLKQQKATDFSDRVLAVAPNTWQMIVVQWCFFDFACAQRTRWGPQKKTMKIIHDSCMVASLRRQFKMDTFQKNQSVKVFWIYDMNLTNFGSLHWSENVCVCVTSNTFISQAFSGTTVGGLSDIISFYFLQFNHAIILYTYSIYIYHYLNINLSNSMNLLEIPPLHVLHPKPYNSCQAHLLLMTQGLIALGGAHPSVRSICDFWGEAQGGSWWDCW